MSQNIMVLNPWGADYMDSIAERVVGPYLHPATDLVCTSLGEGASPMPWPVPESRALVVDKARKSQEAGFDAIVIGCCADPFLADLRRALSIPVVGLTESFCMTAKSRGKVSVMVRGLSDSYRRFIATQDDWKNNWSDRVGSYGLTSHDFSVRRVFVPGHPDPEALVDLTSRDQRRLRDLTLAAMSEALLTTGLEQANAAAEEDGANAVFFACAFWGLPIHSLQESENPFRVPVVNPLVSGVSYAEHLLLSGVNETSLTSAAAH